jgi:hypothetical protein
MKAHTLVTPTGAAQDSTGGETVAPLSMEPRPSRHMSHLGEVGRLRVQGRLHERSQTQARLHHTEDSEDSERRLGVGLRCPPRAGEVPYP